MCALCSCGLRVCVFHVSCCIFVQNECVCGLSCVACVLLLFHLSVVCCVVLLVLFCLWLGSLCWSHIHGLIVFVVSLCVCVCCVRLLRMFMCSVFVFMYVEVACVPVSVVCLCLRVVGLCCVVIPMCIVPLYVLYVVYLTESVCSDCCLECMCVYV